MKIDGKAGWLMSIRVEGDYLKSAIAMRCIYGTGKTFIYDYHQDQLLYTGVDNHSDKVTTMEEMLLENV